MEKMNVYLCQFNIETPPESDHEFIYFPYSVGLIWTYATTNKDISNSFTLKEFLIRKEPIDEIVESLENPSVMGFSSYVWNHRYNLLLAKAVKNKFPDCRIIFGGPSVPYQDKKFLLENNFIDFVIYREGEIAFQNLLLHLLDNDIDSSGIGYIENNTLKTSPAKRIANLDDVPSPYTSGLFDDLVTKYKNTKIVLNAIIETNRGCPFGCTFCDWGNLEFGKIKKVGTHRIQEELEWIAKNKIEYITNADANFGIFQDRDVEITKHLVAMNKKYNYPQIFDTSWNKVFTESLVEIAVLLTESKMIRRFMASFQSLNELTNKAIKRKNISLENFYKIFEICQKNDINIGTELILPLPEETYDSFIDTIERFHNLGIVATVNLASILPNAEMSKADYRQKYGLITQLNPIGASPYCEEVHEMVIGTNTMSVKEFEKASTITFLMEHLNSNGFCDVACRYISKFKNIRLSEVYFKLYEYFVQKPNTVLYKHFQILIDHVDHKDTQKLLEGIECMSMFNDIGHTHRQQFFNELKLFLLDQRIDQKIVNDICLLQNHRQKHFDQQENYHIQTQSNVNDYIFADDKLIYTPTTYNVINDGIPNKFKNYGNFIVSSRLNQNWKTKVVKK
tara:strand:- start:332 stop:2197 length:1866 start_codon:yes stop_codon:yes gene_type:complete